MVKVMVVDDEPLEREAIRFILERERPQVKVVGEAGTGRKALQLARELQPDIVFMDIHMPGVDGIQATQVLKDMLPKTKVVILTAYDEFEFAYQAFILRASDYLLKPARPQDIIRVVDKLYHEQITAVVEAVRGKTSRRDLQQVLPFIETGFVLELINGQFCELRNLQERATLLGLPAGPYQVFVVEIDHFPENTLNQLEQQLMKQEVYQAVLRTTRATTKTLVAPLGNNRFVALVCLAGTVTSDTSSDTSNVSLEERLRHEVALSTPCTVTVGAGTICNDLSTVYHSYVSALHAVQNNIFLRSAQVVASQIFPRHGARATSYPYQSERHLLEKVQMGDAQGVRSSFRQLWQELVIFTNGDIELTRTCTLQLAVVLTRSLLESSVETEYLQIYNRSFLEGLALAQTVEAMEIWLKGVLDKCLACVNARCTSVQDKLINCARHYIKEHFAEPISLKDVSREVHLSEFYFSRLFRNKIGINFREYLTRLRLEEAKRLLLATDDTVAAIAKKVGYPDANYFSRLFRLRVGITPNEYRSQATRPRIR